jgi:osmotically-inducible protein OsmY
MMRRQVWTTRVAVAVVALALSFIGLRGATPSMNNISIGQDDEQLQTDEAIRSSIEKRLLLDERIDWELLQVEVNKGHAILYGEVRTTQEKGLASLIASTVPGVKGLTNSIIVEPAMAKDHKLANAVWNVLHGVPALSGNDTLKVNVKNAVVKLEGVVERSFEKEAAEKAVASVPGVATVFNLIEVKSQVSGESVTEKAREKLLQEGVQVQP